MLFSTNAAGQRSPLQLTGFAGGNGSIEQLQQALVGLARVTGRPTINPGIITGTVNEPTMRSLMSILDMLSSYLAPESFNAVSNAFQLGTSSSQARTTIAQNAQALTMAVKSCVARLATSPRSMQMEGTRGMGRAPLQFLGPAPIQFLGVSPWYQSTGIMVAAIGAALLVGYKLFGGK